MLRKHSDLVFLLIFSLIIVVPVSAGLPARGEYWDEACGSRQDQIAQCYLKAWFNFPPIFNEDFSQQYRFYPQMVNAYQSIRLQIFRERVFPNVIIGKQNWMFYTGENNISDFECTFPFNQDELQNIRRRLLDWQDQLRQDGIRFYVVIAPNKETVYPQYLPDSIQSGVSACRVDQVSAVLQETDLKVLDLRAAMQDAALSNLVYHRTDTHWNAAGALLAANEIVKMIRVDFPQLTLLSMDDFQQEIKAFSGDLAGFLPAESGFEEQAVNLSADHPPFPIFEESAQRRIVSTIPGSGLPRAVVFRDSFADALLPFLSRRFSESVYIHSFSVDMQFVSQAQPDLVIFEIAQRYLTFLR